MVLHFPNYESAALHVARVRGEGYAAWVWDVHSSLVYGPVASGGCRVLQSDSPLVEDDEEENPLSGPNAEGGGAVWIDQLLRMAAVLLAGACGLCVMLGVLRALFYMPVQGVFVLGSLVAGGFWFLVIGLAFGLLGRCLGADLSDRPWWWRVLVRLALWLMAGVIIAAIGVST